MIELSLPTAIWFVGLMFISLTFKSFLLSFLTGIFIIYEALLYTQVDIPFTLLLVGYAATMLGYSMIFSNIKLGSKEE